MSSFRNYSQLPTAQRTKQPTSQLLLEAAKRFWLPALALCFLVGYLANLGPSATATTSSGSARTSVVVDLSEAGAIDWDTVSSPLPLSATTADRLLAWESSPRFEPANWVSKSIEVRHRITSGSANLLKLTPPPSSVDMSVVQDQPQPEQAATGAIPLALVQPQLHRDLPGHAG